MERFIHQQNIRKFVDRLASERDPGRRATLMKLLVQEEDRLGRDKEHLAFVNSCIASTREVVATQRALITELVSNGLDTGGDAILLASMLEVQRLFEAYQKKILDILD